MRKVLPLPSSLLALIALVPSARADMPGVAGVTVPAGVAFCPDQTYCTVNGCDLKLNVAHPRRGPGPFPAVVLIHGGGWLYGSHRDHVKFSLRLAAKGYVAVTITYRLSSVDRFPAQIHDVKCAVRWLRANAGPYRVDKERIGVFGHSAGAHLACMLGLTCGHKELEGAGGFPGESSAVKCVVCCSALTDLEHLHACCVSGRLPFYGPLTKMAVEKFVGGPPARLKERYVRASPITYVCKEAAPTLLVCGTKDAVIPTDQSRRLEERLREAGVEVGLLTLEGASHDFTGVHAERAEAAAIAFFDRHLKGVARRH